MPSRPGSAGPPRRDRLLGRRLRREHTPFPGTAALLPTLGTAALILAGSSIHAPTKGAPAWLLSLSPVRYVGRISYSWYLWHWHALIFAAVILGPLSVPAALAVVAVSWIPTAVTHHLIEDPLRLPGHLRASRTARPNPLRAAADRSRAFYDGCLVGICGTNSNKCLYGDPNGKRTLILFGDSHAMQYFPALEELADTHRWRLIMLTKAECIPGEVKIRSMIDDREYSQCDAWRQETCAGSKWGAGRRSW